MNKTSARRPLYRFRRRWLHFETRYRTAVAQALQLTIARCARG